MNRYYYTACLSKDSRARVTLGHSSACSSQIQGKQISIMLLLFAQAVREARFQTSQSSPPPLRGKSACRLRRWPTARQKSPPVSRQVAPLLRNHYRARAGRHPLPRHATLGGLHPRWLQAALDRRGQYPTQGAPSQPPTTQNHGEI